ncbi:MAG TPA: hypothetical protein VFI73_04445 [Candidatus Nitrosopolaris sp.]|nr:hypothetical protein [Candidatus Nitrosopolaris sp.]
MYTKTPATFGIVIVATLALVLIAAASLNTISALAWNHGKKSSNTQNNIATSSGTPNADLKSLFTCISAGANDLNGLTQDKVLSCYTQTLKVSNGNNNPIETSDSG